LNGYQIVCAPKSIVYHQGYGSKSDVRYYHEQKNIVYIMIKNYDIINVFAYVFPHLFFTLNSLIIDIILKKNFKNAKIKINAILWIIKNIKLLFKKRSIISTYIRKISDKELKKSMLQTDISIYILFMLKYLIYSKDTNSVKKLYKWYFDVTKP
jgi:GT2 family glycosyltransferase